MDPGQSARLRRGAVPLTCLFIPNEAFRGLGLGKRLLEAVIQELRRRGFRALETFARRGEANNPSGPMEFYLRRGFHVKDETDAEFPLMRLDFTG